jgi:hypothetical protein
MRVGFIESRYVCSDSHKFTINVGYKHYVLGIIIYDWGVRIMLIWWHLCIYITNEK